MYFQATDGVKDAVDVLVESWGRQRKVSPPVKITRRVGQNRTSLSGRTPVE